MLGDNNPRGEWSLRLENVLGDYDALTAFQNWMGVDDDSSEHPLRLHFAIVAYREMVASRDARANQLARDIFAKFLRPKSGLCAFIEPQTREEIGKRLKHMGADDADPAIFDGCTSQLETFLRRQHAIFIESREFLDFFNSRMTFDATLGDSDRQHRPHRSKRRSNSNSSNSHHRAAWLGAGEDGVDGSEDTFLTAPPPPRLTASTLLRTQKEREATLGESSVEKMFRPPEPISRYPYVGNATTSKKDSAVSSSFSSEANASRRGGGARKALHLAAAGTTGGHHRHGTLPSRLMREEHRRVNPVLSAALPRPEPFIAHSHHNPSLPLSSTQSASHDSDEGRRKFATQLTDKLRLLQSKYQQYEKMNRQIEQIATSKSTAREVIKASDFGAGGSAAEPGGSDPLLDDDDEEARADDDVDQYFKLRMLPTSGEHSNGTPHGQCSAPNQNALFRRSCSPLESIGAQQSSSLFQPSLSSHLQQQSLLHPPIESGALMMSQSYTIGRQCCAGNGDDELSTRSTRKAARAAAHQQLGFMPHHHPQSCSYYGASMFQPQQPHANNAHLCASTSTFHSSTLASSSMTRPPIPPPTGSSSTQRRAGGFSVPPPGVVILPPPPAPPSQQPHHHTNLPPPVPPHQQQRSSSSQRRSGAAAPGVAPNSTAPANNDGDTSGIGSMTTTTITQFSEGSSQQSATTSFDKQRAAIFKKARELSSQQQQSAVDSGSAPTTMSISYKDFASGVPVMANVPRKRLTFKEFRRYLSIPSKDKRQFFFKAACEDEDAPYQLLLVTDDTTVLPTFDGKITAECRAAVSPDESD